MADCQLCGAHHPEDTQACPQSRTGQTIGSLTVGPLLGVGGMAAVYAADDPVVKRAIAIKILHKRYARDRELAVRFVREARETAALGHPAFVRVYDAGDTDDGCPFIEMDRLTGDELYVLRKAHGPLPIERVVTIAIGVLDALAVLHERGVIHRDLKSQNIYLVPTPEGERVMLLDLGFAKVASELKITSKDHILGTPFYISPEQYTDPSAVDARADLFSLGIVMFEVLTGDWPYQWTSKRELLGKVMHGDLERHPAERRRDVPSWLDAIVAKALAHKREERFESALAMKDCLERREPPDEPGFLRRVFGLS
jgi:eukaryotic-like serine/threonine-protein kinase